MQLEEFLEESADHFPDKAALVCGERRLTYATLAEQSARLAGALLSAGLERGERVVICLDNSVETVVSIFAILQAGGVFVPLNPTTKADKVAYVLNDCGARMLITAPPKLAGFAGLWDRTAALRTVIVMNPEDKSVTCGTKAVVAWDTIRRADAGASRRPPKRCIDIDLAALIYTSGSTGNPKGVMVTHRNMISAATSITTYLENVPDDIILNVLPLSFDYGLYQVLMACKVGATLILERSFTFPAAVLKKLAQEKVTGFPIVPTMAAILLQMDLSHYDLSSLRYVTNTAAALPTEHIQRLRALFPNVKLYSMYGLTECKRVAYLPPDQVDIRPKSVGKAMPNTEAFVVNEQGGRVGPGVVGELVVRGANVMCGYWGLPNETARMLKPGPVPGERMLYTGDLFRTDEEGYLYFVGRKDDIIKSRGEKVSPREVENVLYSLDGIAEAAVLGVPDPVLGQAIKAVVALRPGARLTDKQVLAHCAQHLEDFMLPKLVEFREALPKNPSGKIDKLQLK